MVGRLLSFWVPAYFQLLLLSVLGRVYLGLSPLVSISLFSFLVTDPIPNHLHCEGGLPTTQPGSSCGQTQEKWLKAGCLIYICLAFGICRQHIRLDALVVLHRDYLRTKGISKLVASWRFHHWQSRDVLRKGIDPAICQSGDGYWDHQSYSGREGSGFLRIS